MRKSDLNRFQAFLAFSSADVTLTTFCSRESGIQHAAFVRSLCCALAANAGVFEGKYPDIIATDFCEHRTLCGMLSAPRWPSENTERKKLDRSVLLKLLLKCLNILDCFVVYFLFAYETVGQKHSTFGWINVQYLYSLLYPDMKAICKVSFLCCLESWISLILLTYLPLLDIFISIMVWLYIKKSWNVV